MNEIDNSTGVSIMEEVFLDEEAMLDRLSHQLCCRSDFLAVCGHRCSGNKLPRETALTCADCVEMDEEFGSQRCKTQDECIARKDGA